MCETYRSIVACGHGFFQPSPCLPQATTTTRTIGTTGRRPREAATSGSVLRELLHAGTGRRVRGGCTILVPAAHYAIRGGRESVGRAEGESSSSPVVAKTPPEHQPRWGGLVETRLFAPSNARSISLWHFFGKSGDVAA